MIDPKEFPQTPYLHTMTDADRQVVKDLTLAIHRLASAQEGESKRALQASHNVREALASFEKVISSLKS